MESYSEPQQRTIAAALALFAKHGVGGTSLQMIADEVGVTKAAIYHQFKTRDAIAIAVVKTELARLQLAVDAADDSPAGRDRLLVALVDTVVERRHGIGTIMNDPLIERFLNSDEQSLHMWTRLLHAPAGRSAHQGTTRTRRDPVERDRGRWPRVRGHRRRQDRAIEPVVLRPRLPRPALTPRFRATNFGAKRQGGRFAPKFVARNCRYARQGRLPTHARRRERRLLGLPPLT